MGQETLADRLGRCGTGKGTLGEVRDESRDLGEVWIGSGDPQEVQDGSGDPWGGPGRVRGTLRRSETGRGTLGKVQDRLGAWGRSTTSWETFGEVQDGLGKCGSSKRSLGEVRDGLRDPRGGPGWVEGTSGRSGMGRVNFGEV